MPVNHRVDVAQGVVYIVVHGVFSTDDVLTGRELLKKDPEFEPGMDQLIDLRAVIELAPSNELKTWAASYPFDTGARRAFVAPADVAFGTMRMYQAFSEVSEDFTRVFRTVDEACEWLGVSTPDAD